VENVTYKNLTMINVGHNVSANGGLNSFIGSAFSVQISGNKPTNKTATPVFRNVHFENIKGTNIGLAGVFKCNSQSHCHDFSLENIHLKAEDGFVCRYIDGVSRDVSPHSCIH